jgi:hypothetical protein
MKWHCAVALFLIIFLAVTAANLFSAWIVSRKVSAQASNSTLGKLFGA